MWLNPNKFPCWTYTIAHYHLLMNNSDFWMLFLFSRWPVSVKVDLAVILRLRAPRAKRKEETKPRRKKGKSNRQKVLSFPPFSLTDRLPLPPWKDGKSNTTRWLSYSWLIIHSLKKPILNLRTFKSIEILAANEEGLAYYPLKATNIGCYVSRARCKMNNHLANKTPEYWVKVNYSRPMVSYLAHVIISLAMKPFVVFRWSQ